MKIEQRISDPKEVYCSSIVRASNGAVAERLRHRSREQRVPSSSPAWASGLYVFNVVCAA